MEAPVPPPMPATEVYEKTEYEDPPEVRASKVAQLVDIVRSGRYVVVYTGAGISTACGIPDFRGDRGMDKIGWLSSVKGMGVGRGALDLLMPSYAHVAVTKLLEDGVFKFIVSSNHDNMHIRSGAQPNKVSEIFGNGYIETCLKCGDKFLRKTQVPQLSRTCDNDGCGGRLKKEGVRFGGMVPEGPLLLAQQEAKKTDVALVLGSSMSVSPFCDLPWKAKKVVLVCLQDTVADGRVNLKINATCDEVMRGLLQGLGKESRLTFEYQQSIKISHRTNHSGTVTLHVGSGEKNEICTCVEEVRVHHGQTPRLMEEGNGEWNSNFDLPEAAELVLPLELVFRPEYGRPPMHLDYTVRAEEPAGQRTVMFTCPVHYQY